MAQKNNYDTDWKNVETLMNKGLSKSAMEAVDKIYARAKKEQQQAQQVKALVYKSQLVSQVEEDDWLKNISSFEKETATATEPVKQILYSINADLYWNYFQNQRWKIYNRTNTTAFKKDDPETWTNKDFDEKISQLYHQSLSNPTLLQQTKLDAYDPIIVKGNQRQLRPTLYDLLAHKALDFYEQNEIEVTQPAYKFELTDYAHFADAKTFIRYNYTSKDTNSRLLAATKLYQNLLGFHVNDKDPAAFIDVNTARIEFANTHSVNPYKNQLYKEALETIYSVYGKNPEAMQSGYLLAQWWKEKGENYNPATGTALDKMALAQAVMLSKEIVAKFPESDGSISARNMLNELLKPALEIQTEKVNLPNTNFRALLNFTNTKTVYLRVVKLPNKGNQNGAEYIDDNSPYWTKLTRLPSIKSWKQTLPIIDDYRQHGVEIKVDGLPIGKYQLLISGNADFSLDKNPLAVSTFYVSNISYVSSGNYYFLLHRNTGKPLANAKVQVWQSIYDYDSRARKQQKLEILTSDANGYFKTKPEKNNARSISFDISYEQDVLFMEDTYPYYQNYYNDGSITINNGKSFEENNAKYFMFLDRSIYRPGQTVFFKAIGITKNKSTGRSSLYLPNSTITVQLKDANYQIVDSLKLTPNEFGSINCKFMLPLGGLAGQFTISVANIPNQTNQNFSVEEYKRPKFYVDYEVPKGSYKINEDIAVTGFAKAFAGNNIDGATVKYRVTRQTNFPYPWLFWKRGIWPPNGGTETLEIVQGETQTDADGKFIVHFNAIPDLSVDKTLEPSFSYTIEADITDGNGETRTGSTSLAVGYKSLIISLESKTGLLQNADIPIQLSLSANNLNDVPLATKATIELFALTPPNRLIRKRYWEKPDTAVMPLAEYVSYFPNDEYSDESNYQSWEKGGLIKTIEVGTSDSAGTTIPINGLAAGWYMAEATAKDKDGNTVKSVIYLSLYSATTDQMPSKQYDWFIPIKTTVEPGDVAQFVQATGAENIHLIEQVVKANESENSKTPKSSFSFKTLNSTPETLNYPATEADRGGFVVNRFYVINNRAYMNNAMINVQWTNKALTIDFETFRDKLLPGQEETWRVKIKGYKADAVAAEMLAGMYDASLDEFKPHNWNPMNLWPNNNLRETWNDQNCFSIGATASKSIMTDNYWYDKRYDNLMSVGEGGLRYSRFSSGRISVQSNQMMYSTQAAPPVMDEAVADTAPFLEKTTQAQTAKTDDFNIMDNAWVDKNKLGEQYENTAENSNVQVRKNFNETAFFFPDLKTNAQGDISFSFTMPEALTKWKLQTLAHTKDLQTAMATRTIVTQKDLMVQPFAPRFLRQGDSILFTAKIVNLSNHPVNGKVTLELLNTETMAAVDGIFQNKTPVLPFKIEAGQSSTVAFPIAIPMGYNGAVSYRIIAKADGASDGEEMAMPVLTNRMLVTESFPINLRNTNEKTFKWERFSQLNNSASNGQTLQNQGLTIEYTSNPAWYAIQALPYLMEYPYDCAEQTWNRFYANALAAKIANSSPKIKAIFAQWKTTDKEALLSNLQKNQELKALLLEETPWVLDAQNEATQKQNIGLLFDAVKMGQESSKALAKLQELQSSNGGFVWFKGGPDDRYMTQYIMSGLGHLRKLDAWPAAQQAALQQVVARAIPYLDLRLKEDYDNLVKSKADLKKELTGSMAVQYLYMRSFFTEIPVSDACKTGYNFYLQQAKQFWVKQSKYHQGMIALALKRSGDNATPTAILKSLTENSINSDEFGMYWKEFNSGGYYWYQAPIESQALLIEAYSEIEQNQTRIDDLKTWLLKQKQTQNWKTTKATAEACYALLLQGSNWLNVEKTVEISLGKKIISSSNLENTNAEAGTGYFKQRIDAKDITPDMGNIIVRQKSVSGLKNTNSSTSWGAVYWQYFEDLDKISVAASPLSLQKKLFIKTNTDRGPVLTPIEKNTTLKVGDKVTVRIELRSDRNLEYVHLKDMRASCFEPTNVLSGYKYQDGLGYYEATKDASTNFFIGYLAKGTYVFEYTVLVTHKGTFSNGISSIQCMYAPEFGAHSEGVRVRVE